MKKEIKVVKVSKVYKDYRGDKGDKGDTGQSLDINFSGDIDNTKITSIHNDSSITEANAYLV